MHNVNPTLAVKAAILTVSDTRTVADDSSGKNIQSFLQEPAYTSIQYMIVKDELTEITNIVKTWCDDPAINTIIITGGTGFSPRDVTFEAVSTLLEKEMQGFGELFRSLSYTEIGPKAMFSRAVAGCRNRTAIYVLPGSTNAVNLAMSKLIIPTVQHFIEELNRQ